MPLPTGLDRDPKSGYFHLRIGVPKDLQPHWPPQPNGKPAKNAFRGSLNTRDRADAIARAHALIAEHHLKFASLRDRNRPQRTHLTPKLVEYLQSRIKYELLEGDDIRRIQGRVLESVPMDLVSDLPDLTIAQRLTLWATWVVRAVYEHVQELLRPSYANFPVKACDRLKDDLGIEMDDVEMDLAPVVAERTGRSLDHTESNPLFGKLSTVADLVRFFSSQPLTASRERST